MIKEIVYSEFVEEVPSYRTMIDENGREVLSNRPVTMPLPSALAPSSLIELMHRMYLNMREEGKDVETFEDAEDFDVPDELGIEMESTPYEQNFDHLESPATSLAEPSAVPNEPEKVTE